MIISDHQIQSLIFGLGPDHRLLVISGDRRLSSIVSPLYQLDESPTSVDLENDYGFIIEQYYLYPLI